ncbi:MAG: magnesium transporter CorA family protein [Blautia sp.]|nr:magnesium transporter CorA family protein [Eubacteriales bacterium]MED9967243.1 magnesium transporter CorA family protein [Blautia sp.]
MIRIFKTIDGSIHQIQEPQEGCWIALTNPTATEIFEISEQFDIEVDDLRAPLDEEERSRIEAEDNYTLILADVPAIEERNEKDWYVTIPLGIILTEKMIFTVCLEDTQVLTRFMEGRVRNFYTYMKTRFILQILYRNASMYLRYLRIIDKKSEQIETKLHMSTRNQELMELLELEKSLVYFTTSLRSNEMVLEKLLKMDSVKKYPEDTELLEDVIIENKQAIEMANIYSGILSSMTGTFASVISNNLNIVMKVLAVITIVTSVPNIVSSAYGMNVNPEGMPFSGSPWGFLIVNVMSLCLSILVAVFLSKKNFFK